MIPQYIGRLMNLFDGSFINRHFDLILVPRTNLYILLRNASSEADIIKKLFAWCSRDATYAQTYRVQKKCIEYNTYVRERLNQFIGVDFSLEDWQLIYKYLGNGINDRLLEEFYNSGYDLDVIRKAKGII